MALPDFLVIGAPDAGTADLHAALARHPGLAMSRVPAPGFFLTSGCPAQPSAPAGPGQRQAGEQADRGQADQGWVSNRSEYEALFCDGLADCAPARPAGTLAERAGERLGSQAGYRFHDRIRDRLRGESTPYYLADFRAQLRIHELLPYVRMIVILRDPVERAYVNWSLLRAAGLEPLPSLPAALAAEENRAADGWGWRWRYRETGCYGAQLTRLYTLFAPQQVLLVRYRDLVLAPEAVLARIFAFLEVNRGIPVSRLLPGRITVPGTAPGAGRDRALGCGRQASLAAAALATLRQRVQPGPPLPAGLREQVLPYFQEDIALLEETTRQSFASWLDGGERWDAGAGQPGYGLPR